MAVLNNTHLTLVDWAKRLDPDGKVETKIAEILNQTNEILDDAVFIEGNLPTGHRVNIRTGLPTVYWRSLNQGVPRSKSTTAQVDESCGMLEAFSAVDKDLADLNGNSAAFRLSEDVAFLEAMNQAQAQTLFYGNPASDPRQYLGLSTRYSTLSADAGNAQNIIDAGGTANNNASVWLVVWGDNTVFCPFPKGSKAGLVSDDDGILTIYDSENNPFKAHQTHYQWKTGLVVKDWRYVVRIANINAATDTTLINNMSKALDCVPNLSMGRPAFYMNRRIFSQLRIQAMNKSQNVLNVQEGLTQFGRPSRWLDFLGVPLRKVDQLLNTEARVV